MAPSDRPAGRYSGRFRGQSRDPPDLPKTTWMTDVVEKGLVIFGEQ